METENDNETNYDHDICIICGADNGPPADPENKDYRGISRVGFDCFSCGSN